MQVITKPGKLNTLLFDDQARSPHHHHHHRRRHPTGYKRGMTTLLQEAAQQGAHQQPHYPKNTKCCYLKEVVSLLLIEMCHFWQISILPLQTFRILLLLNTLCQTMVSTIQEVGFWVVVLLLMPDFTLEQAQGINSLKLLCHLFSQLPCQLSLVPNLNYYLIIVNNLFQTVYYRNRKC